MWKNKNAGIQSFNLGHLIFKVSGTPLDKDMPLSPHIHSRVHWNSVSNAFFMICCIHFILFRIVNSEMKTAENAEIIVFAVAFHKIFLSHFCKYIFYWCFVWEKGNCKLNCAPPPFWWWSSHIKCILYCCFVSNTSNI